MAELVPFPFARLLTRMFRELDEGALFDLPETKFYRGDRARDLSVRVHGHVAATPLGPAAGPHSQLAQNIVLAFLGGGRVFELKTVQIKDRLQIPRPCIDLSSVGFNVEWSQELTLDESLEEYVKASMLLRILVESGRLQLAPGYERHVFDLSVGYDLAGLQSAKVLAFLRGMLDATPTIERLRAQIPAEFARFRDLDFAPRISDTLTLSTFHGCPPDEIERMVEFLLREVGLHVVVKLNPTLLGPVEARRIFHDALGFSEKIPDAAFTNDAKWAQAVDFVGRLGETAAGLGRGFGVKFSNTLLVENGRDFFPKSEKEMYLSGPPLHVLAMHLVKRFRDTFGDRFPISFSAGIDKDNFADAVALGLKPVTVCSDLLRPGGYGRMHHYFTELARRMTAVSAVTLDELVVRTHTPGAAPTPALLSESRLANTSAYVATLERNPRYQHATWAKPPRKVGSTLRLFDCLTCDKCVPVCPNDANFTLSLPPAELPVVKLRRVGAAFQRSEAPPLKLTKKHQLANFADLCNECGNCDIFCPEDGGPYKLKPRFFGSLAQFQLRAREDGFFVEPSPARLLVLGRFEGKEYRLELEAADARFSGAGFDLRVPPTHPEAATGEATEGLEIDLTYFHVLRWLGRAVVDGGVNYVNA